MNSTSRIYIACHRGLVGSAILRDLQARGTTNFALRTHTELGLERQADVWMQDLLAVADNAFEAAPDTRDLFHGQPRIRLVVAGS